MSAYQKPRHVPSLPQGGYRYLPEVKAFGPHLTPLDLQNDINIWLATRIAVPEIIYDIGDVNYQATQQANNTISYTAMLAYTLVIVD